MSFEAMVPYRLHAFPYERAGAPDGEIVVHGPQHLRARLARVPGVRTTDEKTTVDATRANFLIVEAIAAPQEVSEDYKKLRAITVGEPGFDPYMADRVYGAYCAATPLLPHQEQFITFARDKRAAFNASEQGTGKTRMAWVLAELWKARRILIVCPKSLIPQWEQEYRQSVVTPKRMSPITLQDGSVKERGHKLRDITEQAEGSFQWRPAVIINYECLHGMLAHLRVYQPDLIIFDESSKLKSRSAQMTRAALKLTAELHERKGRVLLLTGTPIGNDIGDLWSQLNLLDPKLAPESYTKFIETYGEIANINFGGRLVRKVTGCLDPAGLMQRLEPVWFRATKATCLKLPPKVHERITLKMPKPLKDIYTAVQKDGAAALGAPGCLDSEGSNLIRLQEIAGGLMPTPADKFGTDWTMEPCRWQPKLEWLEQWVKDRLVDDPQHRVIIWCRYRAEMGLIGTMLRDVIEERRVRFAHGDVDNQSLDEIKASFNSRDPKGVQVIVAQIQKLAYGHNLQACDTNIFYSHTWSYIDRSQAEDRSHRHGREQFVRYIDLVLAGTVDEDIMKAMERKESLTARFTPETALQS